MIKFDFPMVGLFKMEKKDHEANREWKSLAFDR